MITNVIPIISLIHLRWPQLSTLEFGGAIMMLHAIMKDSRPISSIYHSRMFTFLTLSPWIYSSVFSTWTSTLSRTVLEHFSNKKEMVPPGTSRTDRCLSIARIASMSTAEKMDSNCELPALELLPFVGIETIFRRMSS